jgi:hypothetical protein
MQGALQERRLLRDEYVAAGRMDKERWEAVQKVAKFQGGRVFIDRKVHAFICQKVLGK